MSWLHDLTLPHRGLSHRGRPRLGPAAFSSTGFSPATSESLGWISAHGPTIPADSPPALQLGNRRLRRPGSAVAGISLGGGEGVSRPAQGRRARAASAPRSPHSLHRSRRRRLAAAGTAPRAGRDAAPRALARRGSLGRARLRSPGALAAAVDVDAHRSLAGGARHPRFQPLRSRLGAARTDRQRGPARAGDLERARLVRQAGRTPRTLGDPPRRTGRRRRRLGSPVRFPQRRGRAASRRDLSRVARAVGHRPAGGDRTGHRLCRGARLSALADRGRIPAALGSRARLRPSDLGAAADPGRNAPLWRHGRVAARRLRRLRPDPGLPPGDRFDRPRLCAVRAPAPTRGVRDRLRALSHRARALLR